MEGEVEEESLQIFLRWATKLGITDSPEQNTPSSSSSSSCLGYSLQVSYFPEAGGRGLAATRDLTKNELILRVPKSALITTQTLASKDKKLSTCIARYPHLSSTQMLSVCLLAEMNKGRSSWWHVYLMQLPRYYDTLASFAKFETQALQVDDAIWATERVASKAISEWEEALPLMRELKLRPQLLGFKWWLWASATVSSRTMHVPWDNAGCLCPVGDFFNYAAPGDESVSSEEDGENSMLQRNILRESKDTKKVEDVKELDLRLIDAGYDDDANAYCFYARKNYRKDEQVLLSYGTYTNLELLELYGFHLNQNPNEKAFIPLEPGIHSDSWPKDSLYIQWDGRPSFALLSALRLWATPQNQRKSVSRLAYSGSQLSAENEIVVMKWLLENCYTLLGRLPSTVDQDILLLDLIGKMHNCPVSAIEQLLLTCGDELGAFLENNKSRDDCNVLEFELSRKATRSIERWKLAIQWRLSYKQMLVQCVDYCTEVISVLSQQLSCKRVN